MRAPNATGNIITSRKIPAIHANGLSPLRRTSAQSSSVMG